MRGGHDDAARDVSDEIHRGHRLIAGAWREVHQEIIQLLPLHATNQLIDELIFVGIPPHNRIVGILQEKRHRGNFDIEGLKWNDPAARADFQFLPFAPDHLGNVRAMNVHVHDADLFPQQCQAHGQVRGHRALADAAFVAHDQYLVTDDGHPLVHEPTAMAFFVLLAGFIFIAQRARPCIGAELRS